MDLVSTVRKSGSRGGVNFSWDEVATSSHRENYLGHSLKAPVGRWQQGKDLQWYAKADADKLNPDETEEERKARLRREEIQKIKEAEEDAMAKALGLPPPVRNTSGANAIEVGGSRPIPKEQEKGGLQVSKKEDRDEHHQSRRSEGRHGRHRDDTDREHRRRHRHRSRSRSRDRYRERRHRDRDDERREDDEPRSRREHGRHRKNRSRSRDRGRDGHARSRQHDTSRSKSPEGAYQKRSWSKERDRGHDRYRRRPSPGKRRSHSPENGRRRRADSP